jgi:long-subunit fatty acid transport protein
VDRNTKDIELSLLLQRRLGQLTNGYFQISSADHDEENLIYDQFTATLGMSYQFGTDSSVGFSIAHLERDAEEDENGLDLNSYEENHASLNVTMGF